MALEPIVSEKLDDRDSVKGQSQKLRLTIMAKRRQISAQCRRSVSGATDKSAA